MARELSACRYGCMAAWAEMSLTCRLSLIQAGSAVSSGPDLRHLVRNLYPWPGPEDFVYPWPGLGVAMGRALCTALRQRRPLRSI